MLFRFCLLFSESVLLLFAPHIHHLPVLVHLHGVVHQAVHVDELDALLLGIEQHRRNDSQLPHLLLCVLTHTHTQKATQSDTIELQHHVTPCDRVLPEGRLDGWRLCFVPYCEFSLEPNNARLELVDTA